MSENTPTPWHDSFISMSSQKKQSNVNHNMQLIREMPFIFLFRNETFSRATVPATHLFSLSAFLSLLYSLAIIIVPYNALLQT